jgi:two-component system sensor histidine kinase HydH
LFLDVSRTLLSASLIRMGQAVDHRKQAATATQQSVFELAHEIRNPLASIKGVADAFLRRGQLTRQEREWMEAVRREVSKIDARLRELLDTSRTHVKQCSLNDLISGVVLLGTHQVNSINDHHGRQISIEFIDATSEPIVVHLDPARIEDVVLNLVLNAIQSIEGDGRVTVRLRRATKSQGDDEALIEVSDTGCGIPSENRRRIFDPLYTTKPDGAGLGLAAVRRTAAAYHGRISFKTRIGRGSKFVFTLPLPSQTGDSCA